jgi:uncharacterized delta-60 repeat protein
MKQKGRFMRRTGVRRLVHHYSVLLLALVFCAPLLTSVPVSAADSDLDSSFDGDGIVTTDHAEFDQINDMVIQPDGRIVAAGHSGVFHDFTQEPLSIMVARYNIDGSLDSTFGTGGIATTDIGTYAKALCVALQADGKILVGGRSGTFLQLSFTLVRYNTDGSLDATFGSGGIVTTSIGSFSQIVDLAIQPDGKIVAAGEGTLSGLPVITFVFSVARYNTDGSLDATFDGDGVSQAIPAGLVTSPAVSPAGIALQMDHKIVVAGTCIVDPGIELCVSRYNSDGSLDSTFDNDGLVVTDFDTSFGLGQDIGIQSDGKIVVAGQSFDANGVVPAIARYSTDGSLDASFDGDGRMTTPLPIQLQTRALALQSDGKIVIVGDGFVFDPFFRTVMTVARYDSDGSIDETFGSGGLVTTTIGTSHSVATAVALQTDGRIVAGGFVNFIIGLEAPFWDFALVRYGDAVNSPSAVTITGPASGSVFAVSTPVNFTGTFTDDASDTHTAEWNFESIIQPATVVEPSGSTPGSANTTFTFSEAGVYKVSLKVTDNGGLSGTATTVNDLTALVVIYDPNGGWVAGGGWIESPQGAFALMPTATGKANFGFVVRYQNGASEPTGSAEFKFNAAGLNFQSTRYDWLVISSGKKAQCQGVGTINGSGSYRFMLTSIDGDQPGGGQDKFRIRIWSDSNGLVYDNQLNAPDGDDPTTILGGGNIVIH